MSKWFKVVVYGLVVVYLVNCLTPLRLHVDMLRYFAIKDCIELGCPADSVAAKDYMPYGYTALLLLLSKIGILHSFVIVLINCLYLFGSLYLVNKLFKPTIHPFLFVVLVLLNWTIIKFVTHPLSEMQYLFFSILSLYFFYQYASNRKIVNLLASFAFGAIAFLTRTVGIALVGALVLSLIWMYRKELILLIRRNRILVLIIFLAGVGVVIFSKQLGLNHYTGVLGKQFDEGLHFSTILQWHFTEWSEIYFNVTIVKLFPFIPAAQAKLLFFALGILLVGGFGWLVYRQAKNIPFIIKAYLVLYALLMFEWPFYDPRFWVPVLPLMAAIIAQTPFKVAGPGRMALRAFFAVYIVLGVVSVGYITYTSLNKGVMAKTHANGVYRNEYETIFFGKPVTDTARQIDPAALSVLQRYN